ncbi:MAG: hypothetical protein K6G22_14030 [Lachnospiraceae bacterium]|nr:hypothetical protein [Lachnospiraceae bacterium]
MKEIFTELLNICEKYRDCHKIMVLFFMAVLVIFLINCKKEDEDPEKLPDEACKDSRVSPAVFVLSIYTGIAYCFALLLRSVSDKTDKTDKSDIKKRFLWIPAVLFLSAAVILSGNRIISKDYYSPADNTLHLRTQYVAVMDRILEDAGSKQVIRVAGYEAISDCFAVYSSRFSPLYDGVDKDHLNELSKDAYTVYEQFQDKEPDMKKVTDALKSSGCIYLVTDTDKYYPLFPASEYGYVLLDKIGSIEIYRISDETGGEDG